MNKALDVAQAFVGDTPTSIYVLQIHLIKAITDGQGFCEMASKRCYKRLNKYRYHPLCATTDGQATLALVQLHNDTNTEQR